MGRTPEPEPSEQGTATPRGLAWAHATEEVRLAMGWNGGVSLAVWMGGVAVELDEARRKVPGSTSHEAGDTASLYQALCTAFNRRLVIDILTGASAGGLNGALLAGAIAHRRPLTTGYLRGRWLQIGDFGQLLQPLENRKPTSIMQGDLFLERMRETFVGLLGTEDPPAPKDETAVPVLLDVQVTNVMGEERYFVDDWGRPFYAFEYRAPVQFRDWGHYKADSLAIAARASASFPAAFEPVQITDASEPPLVEARSTWAIDGGLMENAPIRQAIELIPLRGASAPVRRYVCYVNAAPTALRARKQMPEPGLTEVLGYAINLPRDGRVVDQLNALDDASRRAGLTASVGLDLLGLADQERLALATALFPTYQRRRAALSLEELLGKRGRGGPGRARSTLQALAADAGDATNLASGAARLPWTPGQPSDMFLPLDDPSAWRWGVRTAQRVVQLELDILRAALLDTRTAAAADAIFEGRGPMDEAFAQLEVQRASFLDASGEVARAVLGLTRPTTASRERALAKLWPASAGAAAEARAWVKIATTALHATLRKLAELGETTERATLFAPGRAEGEATQTVPPLEAELSEEAFQAFVARALEVEVIRRSFADDLDIESAQTLHVAQITPQIECPLLDLGRAGGPRSPAGDSSERKSIGPTATKDKLCGIRLAHFAGFYRRSWRANDFMWGRFDGAASIARLMIDVDRARAIADTCGPEQELPWEVLANAVFPAGASEADGDRKGLIEELVPGEGDLKARLETALKKDLLSGDGELARAIVARALQYEIARTEIGQIVQAAKDDHADGAVKYKLPWPADGSLNEMIKALRNGRGKTSLPGLLGADDRDEGTSTLALRTLSQTLLVAVAALSGSLPLARILQPTRVPLLAVRGTTARRPLDRLAVVAGFTGASWYVTARLLALIAGTTSPDRVSDNGKVPLNALWTAPVLAYWVGLLAVLGVFGVPALRVFRTRRIGRGAAQAAWALGLIGAGGIVFFVEAVIRRGMSEALTTWSAPQFAPAGILGTVAVVGGLHAASSSGVFLRITGVLHKPLKSWVAPTSILLGAVGATLAVYAAKNGLPHSWPDDGWSRVAVVLAGVAPLLSLAYVRIWAGWKQPG